MNVKSYKKGGCGCCVCGQDLDKAKGSKKVRYWIQYRLPDGKQHKECVSFSIEEARDVEGKRRAHVLMGDVANLIKL
jgi:hypothetical protein